MRRRAPATIGERNDPAAGPGDPYPFQGGVNPFTDLLERYRERAAAPRGGGTRPGAPPASRPFSPGGVAPSSALPPTTDDALAALEPHDDDDPFYRGTTSIVAADKAGWLVSITPSGGWVPAVIAGRTGIGLSQRMQAFVLDPAEGPFNVVEPGKRPRSTLTPSLAVRDGKPWLAFAVQGGDSQDQNLLQFFLNVVEFGMTPQEASEAANMNSFQLHDSFADHPIMPGRMQLQDATPPWVRSERSARRTGRSGAGRATMGRITGSGGRRTSRRSTHSAPERPVTRPNFPGFTACQRDPRVVGALRLV